MNTNQTPFGLSPSKSRSEQHFMLFATAIGSCAIAWNANGIVNVLLPEANEHDTRARLARRLPDAHEQSTAPPDVQRAIDNIVALLRGDRIDLCDIALDMADLPPFNQRVYEIARRIPPGQTSSYGDIARQLGDPNAARAVGKALGENPFPIIVPCHRVLAAGHQSGGFSAPGGVSTKLRLLLIERAQLQDGPGLFDS